MKKVQWIALAISVALVMVLYFGFDRKPESFKAVESTRTISVQSTSVASLILDARSSLEGPVQSRILGLENQLKADEANPEILKELSSAWYSGGQAAIAGHYAMEVANIEGTAEAWSIAGTTFSMGLQGSTEEKIRSYCLENGVASFEKAISLEPEEPRHRLNLALLYTEEPPASNPMQGILMLVDLQKKYPEEASVLFHLGRLAIQTGQTEKAVERLSRAAELRSDHRETWCLLATAYEMAGDNEQSAKARMKCDN